MALPDRAGDFRTEQNRTEEWLLSSVLCVCVGVCVCGFTIFIMVNHGLTSHLSISYLLAELSELLIHRLGSPKGVVAGI